MVYKPKNRRNFQLIILKTKIIVILKYVCAKYIKLCNINNRKYYEFTKVETGHTQISSN